MAAECQGPAIARYFSGKYLIICFVVLGYVVCGWHERGYAARTNDSVAVLADCVQISIGGEDRIEAIARVCRVYRKQLQFTGEGNSCG